jgi:hypothetical protein
MKYDEMPSMSPSPNSFATVSARNSNGRLSTISEVDSPQANSMSSSSSSIPVPPPISSPSRMGSDQDMAQVVNQLQANKTLKANSSQQSSGQGIGAELPSGDMSMKDRLAIIRKQNKSKNDAIEI